MNHAERVAQLVLEAVLPGATLEYRSKQSSGEYDFDLHYRDGTIAALEVTSSVDEAQVETIFAIQDKKKGGSVIRAVQCKKSWIVFAAPKARINEIRSRIDEYLCKVEVAGIEYFSCIGNGPPCVQAICHDLQVSRGSVIRATPATIRIASPGGGGGISANSATEAGEREAWKEDNRKKLAKARTDERHIVVYIHLSNGSSWMALTSFNPPLTPPRLPSEITHIWLVSEAEEASQFVIWYANIKDAWRSRSISVPDAENASAS